MGKFALIYWTNSNSTSVVPSTAVDDKEMLDNSMKIGKVAAVIVGKKEPGSGWKKHDGRVLFTHDKQSVLKEKEKIFLEEDGSSSDEEMGRGHRQPKRKRFLDESSDEDEHDETKKPGTSKVARPKMKMVKQAQHAQAVSIIDKLKSSMATTSGQRAPIPTSVGECCTCSSLKKQVKALAEENAALRKGLPGIVRDLAGLVKSLQARPSDATSAATSSAQPVPTALNSTPPQDVKSNLDPAAEYELGPGVTLSMTTLQRCNHSDYKRLTRDLMCVLFTHEEMLQCSVLGKKGVGNIQERPALPQVKVNALIDYVLKKFAGLEYSYVRQTMSYKLKDIRSSSCKSK